MADGASVSQSRFSSIVEVTRGTTPSTPAYNILPVRQGTQFQADKNFEQSTLIDSTREPGKRIGGTAACSGTISMPLVRETGFTQWLESALSGTYAALAPSAISGTWAASGATFTRASGSFATTTAANRFKIGDLLFSAGTTSNQTQLNGAINDSVTTITVDTVDATTVMAATGYLKIDNEIVSYTGRTATSITGVTRGRLGTTAASHLDNAPVLVGRQITGVTATVLTFSAATIANEGPVSTTFTTTTNVLVPSTTRKFYSVEQFHNDKTLYRIFKGVEVNTASFTVPTSGEIGVEFACLGTQFATGQVASSTYTATSGRTPFAASQSGSSLLVDGSALSGCVESLNFTVNNNRAIKNGVGEQYACFVEEGIRQIDANASIYLVDNTLFGYFTAETRIALDVTCVSADGDRFQFCFPRLVLTGAPLGVSGNSFVENFSLSAEKDTDAGTAFYVRQLVLSSV